MLTQGGSRPSGNAFRAARSPSASDDAIVPVVLQRHIFIRDIPLYLIFHIAAASGGVDYHPQGKGSGLWHGVELLKAM